MGALIKNILPLAAALFLLSACNDNQTAQKVGCSNSDGEYFQVGFEGTSDTCDARIYVKKQEYADSGVMARLDAYTLDDREISITWTQVDGPEALIIDRQALNAQVVVPYVDEVQTLTFEVSISDGLLTSTGSQVVTVLPLTQVFRPVSTLLNTGSTSIQLTVKGLTNGTAVSVRPLGGTAVEGVDYRLNEQIALEVNDNLLNVPITVLQSGEDLSRYLHLEFSSNGKTETLTFVIASEVLAGASSAVSVSSSSVGVNIPSSLAISSSSSSSVTSSSEQSAIPLRFEDACNGVFPSDGVFPARVDNPYVGADLYVDPNFESRVESTRVDIGDPQLAAAMELVKTQSTSIWVADVEKPCGVEGGGQFNLVDHIVSALGVTHEAPMTMTLTIYNIPGREFGSRAGGAGDFDLSAQGELGYRKFIDTVAALMASAPEIRFVVLLEPHTLAKLADQAVSRNPASDSAPAVFEQYYKDNLAYAIGRLSQGSNIYTYLDVSTPEWVDSISKKSALMNIANEVLELAGQFGGAVEPQVEGFVANTLNYIAYEEPFIDDVYRSEVSRLSVVGYIDSLRNEAAVFPSLPTSFIVDSSRNGWGRPDRPNEIGYGKEYLLDNRGSQNSWCNLKMAGMGQFPTANPDMDRSYIQAFYWFKPPGESDGDEIEDEYYGCASEAAMPAPPSGGQWFEAHFIQLINYAWPRLLSPINDET